MEWFYIKIIFYKYNLYEKKILNFEKALSNKKKYYAKEQNM